MAGTNILNDYIAGAVGGCAGMAVGHPLDTVKVQMQTQNPQNAYKGLWDCIQTVSHQNLSKGFFRGMSWPLASFAFVNSIFFGMYGHLLQLMVHHSQREELEPHFFSTFGAGFLATLPTIFIYCPVEVIKVTLQSQIEHELCPETGVKRARLFYSGPMEAARDIISKKGMRGLFTGFWAQLARDSPANAIYMSFYEVSTFKTSSILPSVPTPVVNFLFGGLAGVISWMVILPMDVVKSRLQADARHRCYSGFRDCAVQAYQQEGFRVFYKGSLAVCLRAFPVNAVTLMVYTEILVYLNRVTSNSTEVSGHTFTKLD